MVAVDPGALAIPHVLYERTTVDNDSPSTVPSAGVMHICGRVEDNTDAVAAFAPFDAYVCDMNVQLDETVACLRHTLPLLKPAAPVVSRYI